MTIIKENTTKYWRGCGENGTLLRCWWNVTWVQLLWKQSGSSSKSKT